MKVFTTLTVFFAYYVCHGINSSSDSDSDSSDDEPQFNLRKSLEKYTDKKFEDKFRRMKLGDKPRRSPLPPSFAQQQPPNPENQPTQRPEDHPSTSEGAVGYTPQPQGATGYTPQQPGTPGPYGYGYRYKGPYSSTPYNPQDIPPPPKFSFNPPYRPPTDPSQYPYQQQPQQQPEPRYPGYGQGPYFAQGAFGRSPAPIPPPGVAPIVKCTHCKAGGVHGAHTHPGLYQEVQQGVARKEEIKAPRIQHVHDLVLNTKDKAGAHHTDFQETEAHDGHICHIFSPQQGYMFAEVRHKGDLIWRGRDTQRAVEVTMYNIGFSHKKCIILLNNGDRLKFKKRKGRWEQVPFN